MAKEIGLPKAAPKIVKKMDEKKDREKGIREGSKADLKADRQMMLEYLRSHKAKKYVKEEAGKLKPPTSRKAPR